jgi:hypothetical protein
MVIIQSSPKDPAPELRGAGTLEFTSLDQHIKKKNNKIPIWLSAKLQGEAVRHFASSNLGSLSFH